ncbi:hypothetical protein [uncultured Flavobacterium sp.]|uniref:hypothetical protein n=1 Tax=uncultured Flavobacterium sp. TaxID=165435 RepID=UPI0030EF5485|tara:strand:+ start:4287 stop:4610 length:324 start_codon:yes stop_codon:yes gene_type:complete
MNEKIKAELISSCINNTPESFLSFLMSADVQTEAPNKMDFYHFFKGMLNEAHIRAKGKLTLKIEESTDDTDKVVLDYSFYDNIHKHSLLLIKVKENNNQILLDVMPF